MEYLSIIWLSYLPLAVSNVCIFSLRSIGENRMSMLVSLAAMGVNALCNHALIFGRLGMPALGVRGAALGTLIARTVEMLFYLRMLLGGRSLFTLDLRAAFRLPRTVVRAFAVKAVPLILNEILWNVGMNVYFWSYARLDETALPAVTIGEQISTIAACWPWERPRRSRCSSGPNSARDGFRRQRPTAKNSSRWWWPSDWCAWRYAWDWARSCPTPLG